MKGKIFLIIMCALVVLTAGTSIAYYNTKSFGFDEDTKIVSKDEDKFTFLDFNFYYKDIDAFFAKAKKFIPPESRTI